jgi:diguanylate cyclase (GGDEF)-like protein/PAS domain S-box-containing protein
MPPIGAPRVLVVEDNPITRKVVRLTLAAEGYEVLEAENGDEAVAVMGDRAPHLVLQDLALGDTDGFELVHRLRAVAGEVAPPIVAFTGFSDEAHVRAAGFDGMLMKPVRPSGLVRAVRAHLEPEADALAVTAPPLQSLYPPTSALPPAQRERVWSALSTMLVRLTQPVEGSATVGDLVGAVLVSFLDASAFSHGAAFLHAPSGGLELRARLGFRQDGDRVAGFWGRLDLLEATLAAGEPAGWSREQGLDTHRALLERAGLGSALVVPLVAARRALGVLVLGSQNGELGSGWLELARAMVVPISQAVVLAMTVAELRASEHRFRGIAESTAEGIVVTDVADRIDYVNPAGAQMLRAIGADLVGRSLRQLVPFLDAGDAEGRAIRADGTPLPLAVSARAFETEGGHVQKVYVLRDLSDRARLTQALQLASRDPLTGLFNRRRFEEELAMRVAECRRHGTVGALLLIDLDRFKPVNDCYGHAAGDAALRAVADVLLSRTRECDLAARLGGDEFVVLLSHTSEAGALACAGKLLDRLRGLEVRAGEHTLTVGASIGVALLGPASAEEVLASADRALYQAKACGRGCICMDKGDAS